MTCQEGCVAIRLTIHFLDGQKPSERQHMPRRLHADCGHLRHREFPLPGSRLQQGEYVSIHLCDVVIVGGGSYTTAEEQEAEMIASLIRSAGTSGHAAGPLGRISAFLGVAVDVDK
jgi:hypothetical protein